MLIPTSSSLQGSGDGAGSAAGDGKSEQSTTELTFIMYYPPETSAKPVWDSCTWITLAPGSSLQFSTGLFLWGTECTQLSLLFSKVATPSTLQGHILETNCTYCKWASWSEPWEGHSLQAVNVSFQKCFWLPPDPFSDVIQAPPNFYTTTQMKFCSEILFALSFPSAFLLPVKNHGCVGWLCKDDIPGQEFLLGFQSPAFAFSGEQFHWLHSSFGHPRDPRLWEVGVSEQAKPPGTAASLDGLWGL